MPSDLEEMAHGLRLAAVAVVSAVITAVAVIGVGQVWVARTAQSSSATAPVEQAVLVRTAG
ncbi:hypothetical protein IFJ75_15545 [Brevundimonas goettingensis]|jgi:hypothetical protein|uniref:Uncharacterized protein n=2 Tax=Brevundimonas goettingensis TaxID=2774190 RepID=A0A975GVJ1_9CAUL|nr:hypothetical protein IFJ75_15545 [Brevundimonas goettingensis]